MDTVEISNIIAERQVKGEMLEEIYAHCHNVWVEEREKTREEQDIKKADEYLAIRDAVATLIVGNALREKGYIRIQGKKFSCWEKKEEQ